ncbi:MAG TPA: AI-2E family transporter [Polyangiaceae bacterium]|nr:AI-2E family transporter [Polyangiaceae bacterium]
MPPESRNAGAVPADRRTIALLAVVGALAAFAVFLPCVISLIVASWVALLARPWMLRLARRFRGKTSAAAVVTSTVVLAVLGPIVVALVPVVLSAAQLARDVSNSQQWRDVAESVIGDGQRQVNLVQIVRAHASSAWELASTVLGISATALFGLAMFVVGLFSLSTNGDRVVAWLRAHAPLSPAHFDRMADAYVETGRGLVIGVGATALIQGALATLTYVLVGIPRGLALGLLTTVGALIPGIGTLVVWGPVAALLAVGGHPAKGVIVALSGVLLIGSVDNFVKPVLSTRARLRLPPVLVFVTMLSGIVAFGPAGLLLGPLFVRIAIEILEIAREERLVGVATSPSPRGARPSDSQAA